MDAFRRRSLSTIVVAADASGDVYAPAPGPGKWRATAAGLLPNADSAANGTNYVTATLTNAAGTTMGSFTTASTGLTAGTYRGFTLTATVSPEVDGDSVGERLKLNVAKSGTGVAVNAELVVDWESVQSS